MKNLYFLRHGLSEANKQFFWGDSDSPLAEEGVKQAITAGKMAKQAGIKFDIVISSPMIRAYDTAKLFAKEIGYPAEKIIVDDTLVERDFGVLEGIVHEKASAEYKKDERSVEKYEGVEKLETMQQRADKYFEYIKSLNEDAILIVGHGAFGRAFRRSIKNEPYKERGEILENAKLYKFIQLTDVNRGILAQLVDS